MLPWNDAIPSITQLGKTALSIELKDFGHNTRFALYDNFAVEDEHSEYKLTVGGYVGNAGMASFGDFS